MAGHDPSEQLPRDLLDLVDAWSAVPAFVHDRHFTVLHANRLARSLSVAFRPGANLLRSTFLRPEVLRSSPDPELVTDHVVGALRSSLGTHEWDDVFERLVDELRAGNRGFARAWVDLDPGAEPGAAETFTFTLAGVGPLELRYLQLQVPEHFGLSLVIWRACDEDSEALLARLAERVSDEARPDED
jgi:hypothetical protein